MNGQLTGKSLSATLRTLLLYSAILPIQKMSITLALLKPPLTNFHFENLYSSSDFEIKNKISDTVKCFFFPCIQNNREKSWSHAHRLKLSLLYRLNYNSQLG